MYTIDIVYWLPMTLLSIGALMFILRKELNIWIGSLGIIMGGIITYWLSPYTIYAIQPLNNVIRYGTSFGWYEGIALFHVLSVFGMSLVGIINLFSSQGKTLWMFCVPKGMKMSPGLRSKMQSLRNDLGNDTGGLVGAILAVVVAGIVVAGAVGSYAVYRFFQSPDITYNISNPPESAYPSIFSAGDVGLNVNLIIIAVALIIVLFLAWRATQKK